MIKRLLENQFWILTGFETSILGAIFLLGHRLDEHVFSPFNHADAHILAWIMVVLGLITLGSFSSSFKIFRLKVACISTLALIWCYMAINFLLTALDPSYPLTTHPLILSMISIVIVIRIMINALIESPEELKGGD